MATKPIARTYNISTTQENYFGETMSEIEMALNKLFGDNVSLSKLSAFLRLIMFAAKESSSEIRRKENALLQRLYAVLDPLNKRKYMSEDDIQVELPLLYTDLIDFLMQYGYPSDASCEQGSNSVFLSESMQKHLAKGDSEAGFVNVTLNDALSVVSPERFMSPNSDCERFEGVGAGGDNRCSKDYIELLNDIEELKYKNQQLNDKNASLQKLLGNEEDSNIKLQVENETLKKYVHIYQDELEKLRAEENQLDELRKMFQRENEYRMALESKLTAWEKERAQHIKEFGEMKIALANVGRELESTKKREKEVSKALVKSKQMQNKSLVLEKKLEEATKLNNTLVQEKKQLEEEISKLNSRTSISLKQFRAGSPKHNTNTRNETNHEQ